MVDGLHLLDLNHPCVDRLRGLVQYLPQVFLCPMKDLVPRNKSLPSRKKIKVKRQLKTLWTKALGHLLISEFWCFIQDQVNKHFQKKWVVLKNSVNSSVVLTKDAMFAISQFVKKNFPHDIIAKRNHLNTSQP